MIESVDLFTYLVAGIGVITIVGIVGVGIAGVVKEFIHLFRRP